MSSESLTKRDYTQFIHSEKSGSNSINQKSLFANEVKQSPRNGIVSEASDTLRIFIESRKSELVSMHKE